MAISLDFNSAASIYFLRVPRGEMDIKVLMQDFGMDFSVPDSSEREAILFTRDPFGAAPFHEFATPAAMQGLGWIVEQMIASCALDTNGRHIDLPADKELLGFQRADVDYILSRQHAFDADEPGLGKTPTSIAVANEIQAKRILVVCPAGLRGQWMKRIKEWTTMHDPFCYAVTSGRYGTSETAHWTVISYDLVRNPHILRGLVKQRFDLLIIDEARYGKTTGASRSRAIFGYFDDRHKDDGESLEIVNSCLMNVCEKTLCLDGTPMPNRPSEVFIFCRVLNWESIDWMSAKRLRERFNPQSKGKTDKGKVWVHEEEGREAELQCRLRAHFMCRHLTKDVRHQLKAAFPDPIYDLIYLEETKAVKQALEAERMLDIDPENFAGIDFKILGAVSTVRQQMGVAMAPQVADYLKMLALGGEKKIVVFTWHQAVTDYLREQLAPFGVAWSDGRNTSHKDAMVQAFIQRPDLDFLIGNILTLGTGTDEIQRVANHCLFAEPDWVSGNNDQAVKRLARIGQLSYVRADFFLVHNSMAEKVLGGSLRKGAVLHKALDRSVSDLIERPVW